MANLLTIGRVLLIFAIPLFRYVPEPAVTTARLAGVNPVVQSLRQLAGTLRELRQYRQAFLMLLAFLVFSSGMLLLFGAGAVFLGTSAELLIAVLLSAQTTDARVNLVLHAVHIFIFVATVAVHVDDGRVERNVAGELDALLAAGRQAHGIPLALQQGLEDLAHDFFVVDDQDGTVAPHCHVL